MFPAISPGLPSTVSDVPVAPTGADIALDLADVRKTYVSGTRRVEALCGVSLRVARGSFTAVMGPSGSGKSTFLHCAAGLDSPTSGQIRVGGVELTSMSADQLTTFRRDRIGFVFQSYNLLPQLTVVENLGLPALLAGRVPDPARREELLRAVGLSNAGDRRPGELSGGQAQRVAIARALMSNPEVLFADEPTGALDSRTGQEVLDLFRRVAADIGQTVVLVTHDPVVAAQADRVLFLADGLIVGHLDGAPAEQIATVVTELGRTA